MSQSFNSRPIKSMYTIQLAKIRKKCNIILGKSSIICPKPKKISQKNLCRIKFLILYYFFPFLDHCTLHFIIRIFIIIKKGTTHNAALDNSILNKEFIITFLLFLQGKIFSSNYMFTIFVLYFNVAGTSLTMTLFVEKVQSTNPSNYILRILFWIRCPISQPVRNITYILKSGKDHGNGFTNTVYIQVCIFFPKSCNFSKFFL